VSSEDLDPQFISFWLITPRSIEWIKAHAVGGVMPNVNESVLRLLPLELPEIGEQRVLPPSEYYRWQDRLNFGDSSLERLAGAFRSWFGFDPVVAKGTASVSVPADAIDLFRAT
jgi:type I restriction enzyme S subunit